MEEKNAANHKVFIQDREFLEITGVTNVEKFTDGEILLETVKGILNIKGEKMHMKQLNLEAGNISIEGYIKMLSYTEDVKEKEKGKGLLQKLLK